MAGVGIFRLGIAPTLSEVSRLFVWLGLALYGTFVFGAVADVVSPDGGTPLDTPLGAFENSRTEHLVSQTSPITLFQEGSAVLLDPEVRSTGLLTFEQVDRAIISELEIRQSLEVVWPRMVALLAMMATAFALAYVSFMHQEVRA